jgi:hypothetical protein
LQLDTLFKGSKKGGTVRGHNHGGGHGPHQGGLPRPQSESDFTEIEEHEFRIESLDDEGVNDLFEKMLVFLKFLSNFD